MSSVARRLRSPKGLLKVSTLCLAVLGAQAVLADAEYDATALATLKLTSADPDLPALADPFDLSFVFTPDEHSAHFGSGDATSMAEAEASFGIVGSFFDPLFTVDLIAAAAGTAGPGVDFSEAFSEAWASALLTVENASLDTGYTIFGEIDFSLEVSAFVDDVPTEGASAAATLSVESLDSGDLLTGAADPAVFADAGYVVFPSSDMEDAFELLFPVSFHVAADTVDVLTLEAYVDGLAEAAPVPVPPALLLMSSAVAVLFLRRRPRNGQDVVPA